MRRLLALLIVLAALAAVPSTAQAATLTVCASGCTYNNSQLQTALDAAAAGDVILLQEGTTYTGTFSLPRHGGASYVTVRTGVTAAGVVFSTSRFPAANVRMTAALATSANLATLRANSNNASALKTSDPSGGLAPEYWRAEWITFASNVSADWVGSGSIITCGSDSNTVVTAYTEIAAHFQLSQVYVTGDPITGQFRGISAHCNDFTIQDSTIEHIKSKTEGQALWCNSFEDGLIVTNTVLSGGTEVMMCGGGSGAARPTVTVEASPAPTQTSATLSGFSGLRVGKSVTVNVGGVEQQTEIASCGGVTTYWARCLAANVTFTAGTLTAAPDAPGDVDWGLNPGGVVVTKSVITRPTALRNAILGTPQSVIGSSATTGGTLAAGTYSYRVVARLKVASSQSANMAESAASTEVSALTTGSTSTASVTWAKVTNASEYRIYGRSAGGQNMYWTVLSAACGASTCTFTDTGSAGTTGSVPTSVTQFFVKNLLELKNCVGCTFEGNIIENTWFMSGGQRYAITLTPSNTGATNDSTQLADIIFRYNKVCHAPGGVSISGRDASTTSGNGEATGLTSRVNISYNLFCDINNSAWGDTAHWMLLTTKYDPVYVAGQALGPKDVTIAHNTIDNATSAYIQFDLYKTSAVRPAENFIHRDNIARKGNYGYFGGNSCTQGSGCSTMFTSGTSVVTPNVLADASCGSYPAGTICPSTAALNADYIDYAAGNFVLRSSSVYNNAASDKTDLGADIAAIEALIDIAESGDNRGGVVVVPPAILTQALPGGQTNQTYGPVTLTGTCNAAPCTWSATNLMTGVTLNSTTGVLSQTGVLVAGTFTPTITYTDAGGRATPKDFAVTIAAVIIAPDPGGGDDDDDPPPASTTRPRFDYQDCGSISAADFPTQIRPGEGLIVCDTLFHQTHGIWYVVSETSPVVAWKPMGSATSVITMNAGGSSFTWTDMPQADTQLNGSTSSRVPYDATHYRSFRWTLKVQGASASANTPKCYVKYSVDDSTFTTIDGTDISLASNVTVRTAWITLPTAAQADVYWRIFCSGGDGAADPAFGTLTLQFRQY